MRSGGIPSVNTCHFVASSIIRLVGDNIHEAYDTIITPASIMLPNIAPAIFSSVMRGWSCHSIRY